MLELLPGPAWAKLVAADLAPFTYDRLLAGPGGARKRATAERAAWGRRKTGEATLWRSRRRLRLIGRNRGLRSRMLGLQASRELPFALAFLFFDLGFAAHLQPRQQRDRVVLDAVEQRAEEFERFALVLLLRVLLRIGAQVDTLAQIIHRGQVLAPVAIELLQHHRLF